VWKRTPVLILVIVAGLVTIVPQQSYGVYSSEVAWELIIISSEPACSVKNYHMLDKYYDISTNYFELYEFENKAYSPQCLTEFEYNTEYEKPHDLDLIILVYDRELGRADLHSQNSGGIYFHQGEDLSRNHMIIICDCSNFYYSDPVWILSHELSHFVLNYLGFDMKIVEDEIHELDYKFDVCVEVSYDDSCASVKYRMMTDRGYWIVMTPYEQALGKSVPTPSSEKAVFESGFSSQMVLEFTNWWLQGDITNENYLKSLEILSGKETDSGIKTNGIFREPPLLVLSEPPTSNPAAHENEDFSNVAANLIGMSPFYEENKDKLTDEEEQIFILWLKTTANSWASGEIKDEDFITDLEYLLNSPKTDLYLNYLDSLSAKELINKGIEFQQNGELRNAMSYFDRALIQSIDSGEVDIDVLILKGSALTALQKYEEALIYFDNVLNIDPENSVALKKKAFLLAQLGQLEEAKNLFIVLSSKTG